MKKILLSIFALTGACALYAQDETYIEPQEKPRHEIRTIFSGPRSSGGYVGLTNKFTTINGQYANIAGLYGGWYINHHFLLGLGAFGLTNDLRVADEHSVDPGRRMSYYYGQTGLVTEYALGSNRAFHVNFNLFAGAGFTFQYDRYGWHNYDYEPYRYNDIEENWFFVMEPGVQVEMNLFRWMRLAPGISYRQTFGSDSRGLTDHVLTNTTYSVTLKLGKF